MSGINKVILIGNLGQDPEIRSTSSGSSVANVSIATSESWADKQSGEKVVKTEWHRVVFFNRLAEVVQQYVKKGDKLYIEGKLQTRKWQDQSGQDRYTTEIIANHMQMIGGRPQQQQQQPRQPTQSQPQGDPFATPDTYADFDEDIPGF